MFNPARRSTMQTILKSLVVGTALAASAAHGVAAAADANDYPNKPINLIVAYAPGGGSDLIVRLLAIYMQKELGPNAKIVVSNKPGAGGAIGFTELARSAPDGYTIGLINTPNVLTIPIERQTSFTWQSFDLLGNIVDDPDNFAVHADNPIKTLQDLVKHAKAHPGAVSVGTTGTGSDDHLAMLSLEKAANIKLNHVPYKGAAEVRTALAGKQIDVAAVNIGEALQFQKGGTNLRNLGVMSEARSKLAPELPTFKEQGYDINLNSLRGMAAPKGLPVEIRERLVKATERAIANPEFQSKAAQMFAPLRYLPPAKYEAELRDAEVQFRQLWKESPWVEK
ncbi:Tripartite-type tricarboxylate transporter, receptor component TctC [Noviherbaspirillum humi]|uniref:Tripartite-type tricarboxylate transporter, receptor component TctC n=2 Tax=Noviherbaspirillum humi TaxID=1688639 RepID=A0A239LEN1_9BURK|nr:Tripartite-type tricarboxylate transporter, receptor component TctC [Noviherbaspirillum humi]